MGIKHTNTKKALLKARGLSTTWSKAKNNKRNGFSWWWKYSKRFTHVVKTYGNRNQKY